MEQSKTFQKLSFLVIIGVLFFTAVLAVAAGFFSIAAFQRVFYIIAGCFLFFFLLMLAGFIGIIGIVSSPETRRISPKSSFIMRLSLRLFMPVLLGICCIFNYKKEEIRRVYIQANNEYILSTGKKANADKMLVILPHCLQSTKCMYRIRNGLEDCHQCGACNLGDIKKIIQRHGVRVELATGGTSARKIILDSKPEFVIAVACERDLTSGIMDVRGLPVYGILNQRPNGPCKDTFVDIAELEERIVYFRDQRSENRNQRSENRDQ